MHPHICAILDYGAGNMHSLAKALASSPLVEPEVHVDPRTALETGGLVLPGVGAFGSAMERLAAHREVLRRALLDGFPCLGICLGMQLLFSSSEEGEGAGLGVIPGRVQRLRARRVPQIGWNEVVCAEGRPHAPFANGFVCRPDDERVVTAWSQHEDDTFPAAVRVDRTVGLQFHPEKSGRLGRLILNRWVLEVLGFEPWMDKMKAR